MHVVSVGEMNGGAEADPSIIKRIFVYEQSTSPCLDGQEREQKRHHNKNNNNERIVNNEMNYFRCCTCLT